MGLGEGWWQFYRGVGVLVGLWGGCTSRDGGARGLKGGEDKQSPKAGVSSFPAPGLHSE